VKENSAILSLLLILSTAVNLTLLYHDLKAVIPAKAGIQIKKTGFPRIKYGAGSIRSGMTKHVN
jgi:hypothetical protein